MIIYRPDIKISLQDNIKSEIVNHCIRKYNKSYLPDEMQEQQAYGILAGKLNRNIVCVNSIYKCKINYRNNASVMSYINNLIATYAIPSDTPIDQRGWVASPHEVMEALNNFDLLGCDLLGSYHMHHEKSWNGIQSKEYPSTFDEKLAKNSNLIMFVVSIISESKYSIKAFYNGLKEKEIEVIDNDS